MEINSTTSTQTGVLKQAANVQEQSVLRLLNDSAQQMKAQEQTVQETAQKSTSLLTGLGTGLDITA